MISVITTTFNYSEFISEAISSILNQTIKDFEYIIVDDGSTDDSESVIQMFDDNRIRFFKINRVGRSAALNFAIKKATYDIIALMDADDIAHPSRLEKELELLKKQNQLVFCNTAFFKGKKIKYLVKNPESYLELKRKIFLHGHLNNSSALFYKDHLIKNTGYDESLQAYEDYDLWLRLLDKSEFIIVNGLHHYMRLHKGSLTTSNQNKLKHLLYSIQKKYFNDGFPFYRSLDQYQKNLLSGWREFFYGNKSSARFFWKKLNLSELNTKVMLCFLLSYLPDSLLGLIKKNRIRLRLDFTLKKFFDYRSIQKEFNMIRKNLNV
jgi:glycosyltransferase involved in cell wall biosynthesis